MPILSRTAEPKKPSGLSSLGLKRPLNGKVLPNIPLPPKPKHPLEGPAIAVSTLKVFDIPIELLVESSENPNVLSEQGLDQLVEGIKAGGFDEPIHVIPIDDGDNRGKYIITSGHHRAKAAKLAGLKSVPSVIKPDWDDDKRKIELVRRNMLRGNLSPEKFTRLYNELVKKGYDASVLKMQMGITKKDAFERIYKQVEKTLNPAQKKKLAEAKERITSIDGLSSVLNDIFKEHGSDLDHGFIVFTYAKQKHHYVECDAQLQKVIGNLEEQAKSRGLFLPDVFKELISKADLSKFAKSPKVDVRKDTRTSKG